MVWEETSFWRKDPKLGERI